MTFRSVFPPVCINAPSNNRWYIIADGKWTEVAREYTWTELTKMWEKIVRPKKDVVLKKTKLEWMVEGSKGNKYRVTGYGGFWSCSCPAHAFGRGKDCKHITQIKSKL